MTNTTDLTILNWCEHFVFCLYLKNNIEYIHVFVLFIVIFVVFLIFTLLCISGLKDFWIERLVERFEGNENKKKKEKEKHKIKKRLNYLKIFRIFAIIFLLFLFGRLFFQMFDIHGEIEYIIILIAISGVTIFKFYNRVNRFITLTSMLKYDHVYDFGNGKKGCPHEINFYCVILKDEDDCMFLKDEKEEEYSTFHAIPNQDFLEKSKYSFKKTKILV